jgi:hypothetical protein
MVRKGAPPSCALSAAAVMMAHHCRIVDRAGAEVPAVEMAAEQDRRERGIATWKIADHVARGQIVGGLAGEREVEEDRLAAARDAGDQVGVGVGECPCRDRLDAVGKVGAAGVRIAMAVGADRADDDAHCALARGDCGAGAADLAVGAVAAAVLVALHRVVDEGDLARERACRRRLERIERREIDDFAFDALVGRGAAVAEGRDGEPEGDRGEQAGLVAPTNIATDPEVFDHDLAEAQRLQARFGPDAGARFGFGAGHARTDFAGEACKQVPGDLALGVLRVSG